MSRVAHNVNLYAVEAGARRPLKTFTPDDKFMAAKVAALVGAEMRSATQRGVSDPDFRLISEQRTADEGGQFVVSAKFQELDFFGSKIGGEFTSLQDLFDSKIAPAPVVPETAEQKAQREAATKSASLSV